MSNRTFLIGLDGATFSVLDPLFAQGVMPFLRSFLGGGARANLRTIVPALTPPAWTSMMTGRKPGQHGVFDFFRLESHESRHIRFFSSHDVQVPTLWSLASDHGMRVTSLNFPAMFPAPRVNGAVIPGWVPWRQLRLACWPEDLFDRLKSLPDFNPKELAMDIKLEERATEGCGDAAEYAPWIELHIRRERNWFEILRHLNETSPADLTGVVFDGVDKLQHLCWRFLRPEDDRPLTEAWELQARELCLEYFRQLDRIIEQLCAAAGPDATVIIASDHGFGPTRDVFYINAWLEKQGYLAWSEEAKQDGGGDAVLGVGKVARHTWMLDWNRTTAFVATPTSNGLYIVVNRDGNSPGIAPSDYEAFRNKLIAQLREVRDEATGQTIVEAVWTKEEAFAGPQGDLAPDLTISLKDGGLVSILPSETVIGKRPAVAGAHRPLGVFGARGPGIRSSINAGELSILDIAPLVLHSLGIAVPAEMQGSLPERILTPAALDSRPSRSVAAATAAPAAASYVPAQMSKEDEQIVMERLRELGYIE